MSSEQQAVTGKTRFYSKLTRLSISVRKGRCKYDANGLPIDTTPGIFASFDNGTFDIAKDNEFHDEIVNTLRKHPKFGVDFFEAKDANSDPMLGRRTASEPLHKVEEWSDGSRGKSIGDVPKSQKEVLMELASSMAQPIAMEMVKSMLPIAMKEMMEKLREETKQSAVKPEEKPEAIKVQQSVHEEKPVQKAPSYGIGKKDK